MAPAAAAPGADGAAVPMQPGATSAGEAMPGPSPVMEQQKATANTSPARSARPDTELDMDDPDHSNSPRTLSELNIQNSYKFLRTVEDDVLRMTYFATSVEVSWSETAFCRVLDKFRFVLNVQSAQDLRTVLGNRELANRSLKKAGRRTLRNRTFAIMEKHLNRSAPMKGAQKERKNALEVAQEKTACFAPVPPTPALIPPVYQRPEVLDLRLSFGGEKLVNECTVELTGAHMESREIFGYLAKTTVPPSPTNRDNSLYTTEMAQLSAVQKEAEMVLLNQEKLMIERRRQMREEAKEREKRKLEAAKKPRKKLDQMGMDEEEQAEGGAPAEGAEGEQAQAGEGEGAPAEGEEQPAAPADESTAPGAEGGEQAAAA